MIKVEEIRQLPRNYEEEVTSYAVREMKNYGLTAFAIVGGSDKAWKVSKDETLLFYLGVFPKGLFSVAPEIWLLLGKEYNKHLLSSFKACKELRPTLFSLYPKLIARSEKAFPASLRFARAFGFSVKREDDKYLWLEA